MMSRKLLYLRKLLIAAIAIGFGNCALAHLMVAQRGTLNFTDKGVYMVLSLPASAFAQADDNGDGQLRVQEFIKHRRSIIKTIARDVTMQHTKMDHSIEGLMLTPVYGQTESHQHIAYDGGTHSSQAASSVIEQIIVMGRFPIIYNDNDSVFFKTSLLGSNKHEQRLTLVAKHTNKTKQHEFSIKPGVHKVRLFPPGP